MGMGQDDLGDPVRREASSAQHGHRVQQHGARGTRRPRDAPPEGEKPVSMTTVLDGLRAIQKK
jgi:hypothetical protein